MLGVTGTDLRKSMSILEIVAGDAQERSWVSKTKLTLDLTVGLHVRNQIYRCTLSPLSLSLTHVMCNSNNYPVPSTVPFLPTEYRLERIYPPWVKVPVKCDPRGDLGWLLDHLACSEGEHAICPLLSVKVNVAQELLRRQSWIGK